MSEAPGSVADALASQLAHPRFAWLAEINARALQARPCIQPLFEPRSVSVHDPELAQLTMSHPFYGFVATQVEGSDVLMYSANDDLVARTYFYYGPNAYETLALRIWHRLCQRAACVFDAGAFTGLYSLVARGANPACEVVAFEPMAHIRHRATMNVLLNGYTGTIELAPYALAESTRMLPAYTWVGPTMLDSGSSVLSRPGVVPEATDIVQGITLDQYLGGRQAQRPDVLKIKVSGYEVQVLAGARRLLLEAPPAILIEVSRPHSAAEVSRVLRDAGYRVFSIDEPAGRLYRHVADQIPQAEGLGAVHNLIACPDDETMQMAEAAV